jgi:uncharacterized protein (TIGR03083 family)
MLDLSTAEAVIDREVGAIVSMLDGATDESWDAPTRLPRWAVRDLARHVVDGQILQANAWQAALSMPLSSPSDVTPGGEIAAIKAAHEDFAAALRAAIDGGFEGTLHLPYGELPAFLVAQLATMEAGVHRSDLAAALGHDDHLPDDVADAAWQVAAAFLPTLGSLASEHPHRRCAIRLESPTATMDLAFDGDTGPWTLAPSEDAADVTVRGSAGELALFALGRRTVSTSEADPSSLTVEGDSSLATRFKTYFPGP